MDRPGENGASSRAKEGPLQLLNRISFACPAGTWSAVQDAAATDGMVPAAMDARGGPGAAWRRAANGANRPRGAARRERVGDRVPVHRAQRGAWWERLGKARRLREAFDATEAEAAGLRHERKAFCAVRVVKAGARTRPPT